MLIGLPPILGPDLLFTLRSMGHGDEIALVDGNYPAQEHARRLIRADGHGILAVLEAVLQVLPIDTDPPHAIFRASRDGDPALRAPIHDRIEALCHAARPACPIKALGAQEIYPRIRAAHTVVATSEPEFFANVILRKGVIGPSGPR